MPTNTAPKTTQQDQNTPRTQADVSSQEQMKGSINFAKVVVRDSSSGEVISTKRVVLLANT